MTAKLINTPYYTPKDALQGKHIFRLILAAMGGLTYTARHDHQKG
jgi:hypothetical protein